MKRDVKTGLYLVNRRLAATVLVTVFSMGAVGEVHAQRVVNPGISAPGPNDGKRPTGWIVRSDATNQSAARDSVRLVHRGKGYYLESGPSSLVWTPKNVARGSFILASTMYSGPSGTTIPEGFGVFLGGKNMQTPQAEFTELLIRHDGRYAVLQHSGSRTVKLKDWTDIIGINKHSGRRDETVRNNFRVVVDENNVTLVVNRTMATAFPRAVFQPDGEYGVRIGLRQLIQVETLGLEKLPK